jgi:hypothetical protein
MIGSRTGLADLGGAPLACLVGTNGGQFAKVLDLPELITHTAEEYESRACHLATHRRAG